jgi:hypothetical protein
LEPHARLFRLALAYENVKTLDPVGWAVQPEMFMIPQAARGRLPRKPQSGATSTK